MEDIHDIYPPVMVGMDPRVLKIAGLCGLALVIILVLVWLIRRYWKRNTPEDGAAIPVGAPPLETALSALDTLDPGIPARAFYYELNAILKNYMGDTLGFRAREMTTRELRAALAASSLPMDLAKSVVAFQENSDPLRYAPPSGRDQLPSQDLARVKGFVQDMDAHLNPEPQNQDSDPDDTDVPKGGTHDI